MVPELEKPRITEINIRMDCNGCVQKIKKALNGINGIYDMYIDFPQQKVTIIGWADPEKIVKAIKKTRKIATICAHIEPTDQAPSETGASDPNAANPPPAEPAPPVEPPKDSPPPDNPPPPETTPSPMATDSNAGQPVQPSRPKDVEEVHVIHHHPPDYRYRYGYSQGYDGHWSNYHNGQGFHNEPQPQPQQQPQPQPQPQQQPQPQPPPPVYVTHSYNTYKPSPYVTEYEYIRSPPRYTYYNRMAHYSDDYRSSSSSNNNITSMFSDENPNACRIV